MGVTFRSKKEIREKYLSILSQFGQGDKYDIKPKMTSPYNARKLSAETIDQALKLLNCYRFCAGIPDEVINDPDYEKFAQDASLLKKIKNLLAHQASQNQMEWMIYCIIQGKKVMRILI